MTRTLPDPAAFAWERGESGGKKRKKGGEWKKKGNKKRKGVKGKKGEREKGKKVEGRLIIRCDHRRIWRNLQRVLVGEAVRKGPHETLFQLHGDRASTQKSGCKVAPEGWGVGCQHSFVITQKANHSGISG